MTEKQLYFINKHIDIDLFMKTLIKETGIPLVETISSKEAYKIINLYMKLAELNIDDEVYIEDKGVYKIVFNKKTKLAGLKKYRVKELLKLSTLGECKWYPVDNNENDVLANGWYDNENDENETWGGLM